MINRANDDDDDDDDCDCCDDYANSDRGHDDIDGDI